MLKLHLNGWQRLHVFLSTIFFVVLIFIILILGGFNTDDTILFIKKEWANKTIEIMYQIDNVPINPTQEQIDALSITQLEDLIPYAKQKDDIAKTNDEKAVDEIINNNMKVALANPIFADEANSLQTTYSERISLVYEGRVKLCLIVFLFWLITVAIVYALGWGIGWIYRGFKTEHDNNNETKCSNTLSHNVQNKPNNAEITDVLTSPWIRFFARQIDYYLFGLVASVIIWAYSPELFQQISSNNIASLLFFSIPVMFIWVFIEPIFLIYYGCTPGKAIFSVRVTTTNNERLAYKIALHRSYLVWMRGMACGIPIITLLTMLDGYRAVRKYQVTSWDKQLSLSYVCKASKLRASAIITIFICIILLNLYMNRN